MHTCVNLYGVLVGWKQKRGRLTSVKRSVHIDRYIDTDIGRCRSQPTSNRSMSVWTYIDIAASLPSHVSPVTVDIRPRVNPHLTHHQT